MAAKNRQWQQAFLPIDEKLLDRLLDEYCAGAQGRRTQGCGDHAEPCDASECAWQLDDGDEDEDAAACIVLVEAASAGDEDAYVLGMRVLDDYLRRRLADEDAQGAAPTLH